MIHVVRIFSNHSNTEKPNYTPEFRKTLDLWLKQPFNPISTVQNNTLFLLHEYSKKVNFDKSIGAIIIREAPNKEDATFEFIKKNHQSWDLGLLKIELPKEGGMELHVKGTDSNFFFEKPSPSREGHKFSNLELNKPVRYRTNFKMECGGGSRRDQRSYFEYDFVIEYLGEANKVEFSSEQNMMDMSLCKTINERKILK